MQHLMKKNIFYSLRLFYVLLLFCIIHVEVSAEKNLLETWEKNSKKQKGKSENPLLFGIFSSVFLKTTV